MVVVVVVVVVVAVVVVVVVQTSWRPCNVEKTTSGTCLPQLKAVRGALTQGNKLPWLIVRTGVWV